MSPTAGKREREETQPARSNSPVKAHEVPPPTPTATLPPTSSPNGHATIAPVPSHAAPSLTIEEPVPEVTPKGWHDYFPAVTGEIDLEKYDLPQPRCKLEWWYYNCHVVSKSNGERFSVFASFFRREADKQTADFFDAVTWAISDVENKEYYPDSFLDRRACHHLVSRLDPAITGKKLQHAEGPILELAKQGRLPRPDRLMKEKANVAMDKLFVKYDDDCILTKRAAKPSEPQPPGAPKVAYEVTLANPGKKCAAKLTFVPQRAVTRHGTHGVVNEMFYYYIPRCTVAGSIVVDGVEHEVEGSGWYDREFGGTDDDTGRDALDAWTWFAVQLNDNSEFTLFNVVDRASHVEKEKVGVLTNANGERIATTDFQLTYKNFWTSLATYVAYPTEWKLVVPSLELELHFTAAYNHQEFTTILVTGGGFYEGRLSCVGTRAGKPVSGTAFVERKNFVQYDNTAGMLKSVGRFVRQTLSELYPVDASQEWIDKYVLGRHNTHAGQTPKAVCDALFKPVRALIDRGGKAWRSLILVSTINAISKKYIEAKTYVAIPELLHVGSLIVDDIQDESTVRRGGRCVHLDYGVATAINAGTACYFMAPILGGIDDLPRVKQNEIYRLYFDVLRSGHAGQGLDIAGLDHLMPAAIETGDTMPIFRALRAIHTYKTGGAAGTICRMAAIIADASDEQMDALENYGTQIGLAFQIVDDALNLRGFEGELKEVGEDIRDGKVTYPIIYGLRKLKRADREYIWTVLREKTSDVGKIASVIELLNSVGAIDACLDEAKELVESAWARLDKVVEDSLPKVMMRCFCTYLTERTI